MTEQPEPVIVATDEDTRATPVTEILGPDILGTDVLAREALAPGVRIRYVVTPEAGAELLIDEHLHELAVALAEFRGLAERLVGWGNALANVLTGGGRLLVAGNGGSAVVAAQLAGEFTGRMGDDRPAYPVVNLASDAATITAVSNAYGFADVFARQVRAHGRPGDLLVAASTSGRSQNLLEAVRAARAVGVTSWALTGPAPNPLADLADDALAVSGVDARTVRELQVVSVHLLCEQAEAALAGSEASRMRSTSEA